MAYASKLRLALDAPALRKSRSARGRVPYEKVTVRRAVTSTYRDGDGRGGQLMSRCAITGVMLA
jgi:hypothetical protein